MAKRPPNVVRLTSPGRGAVATLLVTGTGAVTLVDALFRARGGRPLAESPGDAVVLGRFGKEHDTAEQIVARRVSDEEVLLHCHGGTAAVARIESLLADRGAATRDWPAWAAEAHADRPQAEALVALAGATTERTASILLDQYQGALRDRLLEISAALAAGHNAAAAEGLDQLLARTLLGLHLTQPWKVALAGPPNTGKSTLINALLGYPRAIVHAAPGTTRDVLAAETSIDGWPVELVDTAGLRQGGHPVETEGVRRASEQVALANLVLLVFDASQPFADQEHAMLERISKQNRGRVRTCTHRVKDGTCKDAPSVLHRQDARGSHPQNVLVVHNKSDLPSPHGHRPSGLFASALTGEGMPELLQAIAERLVPAPPAPGEPVPWTRRQIDHLIAARAALARRDAAQVATRLAMTLGARE